MGHDFDAIPQPGSVPLQPPPIPDLVEVRIPVGGRAIVVSDLHLSSVPTAASQAAAEALARRLGDWAGPGVLVLAGDCFELLGEGTTSPARALAAHPDLAHALRALAPGGRRLVALAGNHDAALAWAPEASAALRALGAEVSIAADLVAETDTGPARVRIEHGHRLDPANAFADPHDPSETPLGHHVVQDLLPALAGPGLEWLAGLAALVDPGDAPAFVASRLFYRRLVRHLGWLLLPFALLALAHAPLLGSVAGVNVWSRRLGFAGLVVMGDVVLVAAGLALGARRAVQALAGISDDAPRRRGILARGRTQNERARVEAVRLGDSGYAGLVTGHTHRPELCDLGGWFYANCGCGTEVVDRRRGRGGLPAVFRSSSRLSWVELEAAGMLQVRLLQRSADLPGATVLERVVGGEDPGPRRLAVVETLGVGGRLLVPAVTPRGSPVGVTS